VNLARADKRCFNGEEKARGMSILGVRKSEERGKEKGMIVEFWERERASRLLYQGVERGRAL